MIGIPLSLIESLIEVIKYKSYSSLHIDSQAPQRSPLHVLVVSNKHDNFAMFYLFDIWAWRVIESYCYYFDGDTVDGFVMTIFP